MTSFVGARLQVSKEVRELLPAWTACLAAILTASIVGRGHSLTMLAYFFGTAGLGALVLGHEYTHRTMPILLAQPAGRARLLATKIGVLAVMLAPISCVFAALDTTGTARLFQVDPRDELFIPLLCALFVAPWFTMLTRSPVAGAVFSVSVPAFFMGVVTEWLKEVTWFGVAMPRFAWWGTVALSAVAIVAGSRLFLRLEAIEGSRSGSRSPSRSQARALTRSHPVWLLIKKELHLQRMTLLIGSLYPVSWTIALLLRPYVKNALEIFYLGSVFHQSFGVAVLSGALAGAEERRAGTLEWQLLMPFAVSKQWLIKVAVVLATTIGLGCVFPALPAHLAPINTGWAPSAADFVGLEMISTAVLIAVVSLWVSSFSSTGLGALLVAIPIVTVVATVAARFDWLEWLSARTFAASSIAALAALLLLACAMVNHRSSDRSPARAMAQLALVAIFLGAGVAAIALAR